jgi:hypothetical protein
VLNWIYNTYREKSREEHKKFMPNTGGEIYQNEATHDAKT